MCLIDKYKILIIGGNENGFLFIISLENKEILDTIKINDISNYSINKILLYDSNDKLNVLCAGGYNTSEKNIISDLFKITFNVNQNSKQIFTIEQQDIIKNAHNSWITGLLIKNIPEYKDKNCNIFDNYFTTSNILNDCKIFFTTSHDKKIKIWTYNNSKSLI